jgi:LysR family transcriptional regulator of gallate degradation
MSIFFNLRHLHAIVQAVRKRNLWRAAEAVNLSQPATTQAIQKVEALVGTPLFERGVTGLFPTEAGEKFALRIENAFGCLDAARRLLDEKLPHLEYVVTSVQLRAIIAVSEHGNYSLAARALNVSQPGVYRAVADFQRLCGKPLFHATSQGLEPTVAVREVARYMSLALAEIQKGVEDVRELLGLVDGSVSIGCLPLARTDLLPEALTSLLSHYPDVKVRVYDGSYNELLRALRHGKIDVILGALRSPPPTADIEQERLFSDYLSILVRPGHPLLKSRSLDISVLSKLDWVVPPEGTPTRSHFDAIFQLAGLNPPNHLVECSSLMVTRGMLLRSDRAGILSSTQARYEVATGLLAVLPLSVSDTERPIGITTRKNWRSTMAASYFLENFRETASQRAANLSRR